MQPYSAISTCCQHDSPHLWWMEDFPSGLKLLVQHYKLYVQCPNVGAMHYFQAKRHPQQFLLGHLEWVPMIKQCLGLTIMGVPTICN